MTKLFAAEEIAEILRELGCHAESISRLNDEQSQVHSRAGGIAWQVLLPGGPPFHTEMLVRVPLWVGGEPFRWANDWNRQRSSQAFAVHEGDSNRPMSNGQKFLVGIESFLSFGFGVDDKYVERFLRWWVAEVQHLRTLPNVEFFEKLPL